MSSNDPPTTAEVAKARSSVYRLIATLYLQEMTEDAIKALRSEAVASSLKELGVDLDASLPTGTATDMKELLDVLAEEYAALFILPGGLSPHESVRLKGLLCQSPEQDARAFYKKCGVEYQADSTVFADHLAVEIEFMAYLTEKEATALDEGDDNEATRWLEFERDFFRDHIEGWVFAFLDDLATYARHPFYKEMSVLTKNFLESERAELAGAHRHTKDTRMNA